MKVIENKTIYQINKIIGIAERENNNKRNYLLVNYLQAKHVPVSPKIALDLFQNLGKEMYQHLSNKKVTFIGFSETATAIGAQIALNFPQKAYYLQTTREQLNHDFNVLSFEEEHSHATEQKLFCSDINNILKEVDTIVFVEDEITTGKTILNFIDGLEKKGIYKTYAVLSIINNMSHESFALFHKKNIHMHYLIKIENTNHNRIFTCVKNTSDTLAQNKKKTQQCPILEIPGLLDPRIGVINTNYEKACQNLSENILKKCIFSQKNKKILFLGTEEFMFPVIYCAKKIEEMHRHFIVKVHATTRSPVVPKIENKYPLFNRTQIESIYEKNRKTFIYNLEKYDQVIILTDAQNMNQNGISDLIRTLNTYGNTNLTIIKWVK